MRYIKPFNENTGNFKLFKQELQDFCETNLAYLLDDGIVSVTTSFDPRTPYDECKVDYNVYIRLEDAKPWDEIKDQVIPFLIRLTRKYNVKPFSYASVTKDIRFYLSDRERLLGNQLDFGTFNIDKIDWEIKEIINNEDKFSNQYPILVCNIKDFRFIIDGYKKEETQPQPKKKSILTKIKSFFK